jgi:hypothetical protein
MTYRFFPYWLDEPNGYVWQVDDGDQEHGETYREVRFEGIRASARVRKDASKADLLAKNEPKAWLEVHDAVLEAKDGVAVFRPRHRYDPPDHPGAYATWEAWFKQGGKFGV